MTINTQKLRAKRGSIAPVPVARLQEIRDRAFRRLDDNARGDSIYVRANEAIELVAAAQALDDAQAALDTQAAEIARLREALTGLIAVCEPNIYPQPDKPNSAWAKLVAARATLQEKSNG